MVHKDAESCCSKYFLASLVKAPLWAVVHRNRMDPHEQNRCECPFSVAVQSNNCALFHKAMKLSSLIVVLLLEISFLRYSTIANFTFGDLYGHFYIQNCL